MGVLDKYSAQKPAKEDDPMPAAEQRKQPAKGNTKKQPAKHIQEVQDQPISQSMRTENYDLGIRDYKVKNYQQIATEIQKGDIVNWGRFYITSPALIRASRLDAPFRVRTIMDQGYQVSIAEFKLHNKSSKKRTAGLIGTGFSFLIGIALYLWISSLIISLGIAVVGIVITTLLVLKQQESTTIRESPFDYGMAIPQQNGGVEASFDALTYLQIPINPVSKEVSSKINELASIFTNQLEAINAVEVIKKIFLGKKESWWDKHGAMAMMMGFTVLCLIIIFIATYVLGQNLISSYQAASNNFITQWSAVASKITGIPLG